MWCIKLELQFPECVFIVKLDPFFSCLPRFCVWQVLLVSSLAFCANV